MAVMSKKALLLEPFSDLPEMMEVVGYGKARRPTGDAVETEIEIILARPDRFRGFVFDPAAGSVSRWIGCGQLGLVPVGSRWIGAVRQEDRVTRSGLPREVSFLGVERLGECLPEQSDGFFSTSAFADSHCYFVHLGPPNVSEYGLVQVAEVLRALFGVSSGFLRQTFDGVRDPLVARDRPYFDRQRSYRSVVDLGVFHLWCRSKPSDLEALMAAAILTNDRMRIAHDGVYQNLSVAPEWRRHAETKIVTPFPFGSDVTFSFDERWLAFRDDKGGVRKRRLITRLRAVQMDFGFETLEISHPGKIVGIGLPRSGSRLRIGKSRRILLQTSQAPGTKQSTTAVTAPGAAIAKQRNICFEYIARGGPERPETEVVAENLRAEALAATADRRSGGNPDIGHAAILRSASGDSELDAADPRVISMTRTFLAVRRAALNQGWAIVLGKGESDGEPAFVKVGVGKYAFFLLLVVVRANGIDVMFADAGSVEWDERALGVIVRNPRGDFDEDAVNRIKNFAVRENARWKTRTLPDFTINYVRRQPRVWAGEQEYADLILRVVNKII